jgi:hypothetical protein
LIADGGKGTKRDLWISMIITIVASLLEDVRAQYVRVRYRINTTAIMFKSRSSISELLAPTF